MKAPAVGTTLIANRCEGGETTLRLKTESAIYNGN